MDYQQVASDLQAVVATEEQIMARVAELAAEIERDYRDKDLVVVGILGGAAPATADLVRAINSHLEVAWMALRSYGSGSRSSGSVRLLKDIDVDINGRHVLVVDDVIDTGLTASWILSNLRTRGPASVRICAMFRKPSAPKDSDLIQYVGFDVGEGLLVGYGLDYAGRYRNLRCCGILAPEIYERARESVRSAQA